jgi:tyrosine-specific transport protein
MIPATVNHFLLRGVLCSIPLGMFIVWNGAILGSISSAPGSGEKVDPLSLLTQSPGPTGLLIQVHILLDTHSNKNLASFFCWQFAGEQLHACNNSDTPLQVFSLFAIATSYIGFVLGLSDFLADLLKVSILRWKE